MRHKTASGEMREGVVVRRAFPFFVVQFGSEEAKFTAAQLHGILVFDVDDDSSDNVVVRKRPAPSSDEESSDDDFVESDSDESEAPQKSKTKKTKYISIDSSGDEDEDAMQDDEDDGTRAASLRECRDATTPRHRRDAMSARRLRRGPRAPPEIPRRGVEVRAAGQPLRYVNC